jgi:hypothetical protein
MSTPVGFKNGILTALQWKATGQPCFFANLLADVNNQTGNGGVATVAFDQLLWNTGGQFSAGTTFTPLYEGNYVFSANILVQAISAAMTIGQLYMTVQGSSPILLQLTNPAAVREASISGTTLGNTIYTRLSAGQQCTLQCTLVNGAGNTAGFRGDASSIITYWSGMFLG